MTGGEECDDAEYDEERRLPPRTEWWLHAGLIVVMTVVFAAGLVWLGRFALVSSMSWSMETYESTSDAQSRAESLGLVLVDGDRVVYGRVTPGFGDYSAYLVVETPSPERLTELLQRSGFDDPVPDDGRCRDHPPVDHGPECTGSLTWAYRGDTGSSHLSATWDPLRNPRTVYISAIQT
ncbi:MAG: hypothetical protein QM809_13865 [Gordonia sp. (in: high G+C Gram-positive bacteria)]|uniref:hypothetical protein n=1 Tax=Gordonia sp. (in: high G+C Gram-positive bacteria) TaxID=84139 RepID=UPI0039E51E86